MRYTSALMILLTIAPLGGCGVLIRQAIKANEAQTAAPAADTIILPDLGAGQSVDALDRTSEAEKAAATAPVASAERELGQVVVALGSPAEQGFWLKSTLIVTPGKGRVVTASGASVNVDLLPGDGAALLSLAAFRALELGLTDLPEVTVFAN